MRIPLWLDREQRIHELKVLRAAAVQGHRDSLRLYARKCAEVLRLTVERDDAGRDVAEMQDLFCEELRRGDRFELAWKSARARARRLAGAVDKLSALLDTERARWLVDIRRLQDERQALHRAATSGIVRAPSTFAPSPDRDNAVRLAAENAALRNQLDDLLKQRQGVPS